MSGVYGSTHTDLASLAAQMGRLQASFGGGVGQSAVPESFNGADAYYNGDAGQGAYNDADISVGDASMQDGGPDLAGQETGEAQPSDGPRKAFGEMKIWTGTWNMGAADPFAELNLDDDTHWAEAERLLSPFVPRGYDLYVLGVQEGVSDRVYEAIAAWTETFRLPLHTRFYSALVPPGVTPIKAAAGAYVTEAVPASGSGASASNPGPRVRISRKPGRAVTAQQLIDEARLGIMPEACTNTVDMLDRVWGRGDGAMLSPKFTGIAVFVAPVVAPYTRLLSVFKHSFGASEGSKGGVGVALGCYDVTMAFINCHMASKRSDMRRAQYCELVDRMGAKLGGRGFGLNESFHHVVWMGDLNTHVKGVTSSHAADMIGAGRTLELLYDHDELLADKESEACFYEYEEPLMGPRFFPTYKKIAGRGRVNYRDPDWPSAVYITQYKEPFYKGGRVQERVPSWTDRIQYHSLADRAGELMPEPFDPDDPDNSPHNYHAVNDVLDGSDHSPVFATFSLAISADETDEALADAIEAAQAAMGYGRDSGDGEEGPSGPAGLNSSFSSSGVGSVWARSLPSLATSMRGPGTLVVPDAVFASLHPSARPLAVVLRVSNIVVEYRGAMRPPRAVSVLYPLPYEDSSELPERAKVVRQGLINSATLFAPRSDSRDAIAATVKTLVSRAGKLEGTHLMVKVSLEDGTKGQAVVCMRDGGFSGPGSHSNMFLLPLTANGLPLRTSTGAPVHVQFSIEMTAYAQGGTQVGGGPGGAAPVMPPPAQQVPGMTAARRAAVHAAAVADAYGANAAEMMMYGQQQQQQQQQQQMGGQPGMMLLQQRPGTVTGGTPSVRTLGAGSSRSIQQQQQQQGYAGGIATAAYAHAASRRTSAASMVAHQQAAANAAAMMQQQQQQQSALTQRTVPLTGRSQLSTVVTDGAAVAPAVLPPPASAVDPRQRVVAMMAAAKAKATAMAKGPGPAPLPLSAAAASGSAGAAQQLQPPLSARSIGGGSVRAAGR